jgi:2-polyprenyl-6-hydroxyphenyl methylase/3-demethylubiquinone-9 3-methyltransferase
MTTNSQQSESLPNYISFIKQNRTIEQATEIYNQRISDAEDVFKKFSHTFQDRACPACGSNRAHRLPDFHYTYGVKECGACRTRYVSPSPSLEALTYYYNECKCNALLGDLLRSRHKTGNIILSERTGFILNLIKSHFKDRQNIKILEIGCSSGAFLSELKDALDANVSMLDVSYFGIDIDKTAVAKNVNNNIKLFPSSAEDFSNASNQTFDLILHFELIEHLQDPFTFMKSVKNLLNADGLHHFHTPNANGLDNTALGYNDFRPLAHGIFPPMHLQAFTPMNMTHFALRSGFFVEQIDTPGNFDIDIVRTFLKVEETPFRHIHLIPQNFLAVFQEWLKMLCASSHMRVTLSV